MTIKEIFDGLRREDSDLTLWWLYVQLHEALEDLLHKLGCPDTAATDIIVEALKDFKAAVRRGLVLNSVNGDKGFETLKKYVSTICKYRWFRLKKRKNNEPVVVPLPDLGVPDGDWENWVENLEMDALSTDSGSKDSWRAFCLADILAILPNLKDSTDQVIIQKHYLQDPPMTLVTIAEELGIAYDTLKRRHSRSMEKLRKLLKHYLTKQTVK